MNPNDQRPVTQGFLRDALRGFATKDDLRGFATKDDLRAFATKDDLRGFATKDDLRGFATKDDLRAFATKSDIEAMLLPIRALLVKHSEELSEIRTHIREKLVTKDEFHHRMDAFAGRLVDEDYRAAKSRTRLDDHEDRITALEKRSS